MINIIERLKNFIQRVGEFSPGEGKKVFYLASTYACLIFSYSIFKPLKDTIFTSFVGPLHQPQAKLIMIIMLPIITALYSYAMGRSKRYYSALFWVGIYAIACISFSVLFLHPTIGVTNSVASPMRLTGWIYYGFFDLFSLTVMTTFWALTSSVSNPKDAALQYGIMTAVSRVAGITSSSIGFFMLKSPLSPVVSIPSLLVMCCCALTVAGWSIRKMFLTVDPEALKGYTDKHEKIGLKKEKPSFLTGVKTLVINPYAFGIFGLACGYELMSTLITYRMQCLLALEAAGNIKAIGSFIFGYTFWFQTVGFFIAIFGTTRIPKMLGMRVGLIITPAILLALSTLLLSQSNVWMFAAMMIIMRALNYGFNVPIREMLFIPTSKQIQFLAKGWIESFGKTFSKTSGSVFNYLTKYQTSAFALTTTSFATFGISILWMAIAFLLGGAYQNAVNQKSVIGEKS